MPIPRIKLIKIIFLLILILFCPFALWFVFERRYTMGLGYGTTQKKYNLNYNDGTGSVIFTLELDHYYRFNYYRRLYIETVSGGDIVLNGITNITLSTSKNGYYFREDFYNYDPPQRSYFDAYIIDMVEKGDNITVIGIIKLDVFAEGITKKEVIKYQISYIIPFSLEELIYIDYAMIFVEVFILILLGILLFNLYRTIKFIRRDLRAPKEERDKEERYKDFFKKRGNSQET